MTINTTLFPHFYLLNMTLLFLWYAVYKKHKLSINLSEHFGFISIFILSTTLLLELPVLGNFSFSNTCFNNIFSTNLISSIVVVATLLASIIIIYVCIPVERALKLLDVSLETNVLRLLVVFSLISVTITNNLIVIFFLLEIYSLSSYVLVGKNSRLSAFSGEASLKYFFISSVFSILMVFSISLLYSITGLLDLKDLQLFFSDSYSWTSPFGVLQCSTIILLISILFKLSAAPFHFWSPDTYEGAPTTIMFFLSVVPKIALFYLLIKLNFLFYSIWFLLILSAILSAYIGSTMGVYQIKFKRLLAYSMINNIGLLVGSSAWCSNIVISSYSFIYLFVYTLTLIALFSIFLTNKSMSTNLTHKNLFSLINLSEINPTKFVLLASIIFTSAGIPPFIGFLIKFLLLLIYISSTTLLVGVILVLLVVTTLSVFYYIRLIKIMSFTKKRFWIFYTTPNLGTSLVITTTFMLSLILLFFSSLMYNILLISLLN